MKSTASESLLRRSKSADPLRVRDAIHGRDVAPRSLSRAADALGSLSRGAVQAAPPRRLSFVETLPSDYYLG